jgi:hypothetical protein
LGKTYKKEKRNVLKAFNKGKVRRIRPHALLEEYYEESENVEQTTKISKEKRVSPKIKGSS